MLIVVCVCVCVCVCGCVCVCCWNNVKLYFRYVKITNFNFHSSLSELFSPFDEKTKFGELIGLDVNTILIGKKWK